MDREIKLSQFYLAALTLLLFYLPPSKTAATQPVLPSDKELHNQEVFQTSQVKVRQAQLQPKTKDIRSEKGSGTTGKINFPTEKICYELDTVSYNSDSSNVNLGDINTLTSQAQGKCLGIAGIRLLAKALQDEVIRQGYITTRIVLPEQNLKSRELHFDIVSGRVGKIVLNKTGGDYISLKNTLPFRSGDVTNLRDLEQGSFNLQRVPGSSVKINLLPGANKGESDIYIDRQQDKFWQIGAWMNDAGDAATGRYQGGLALYLNNPTSLSDTFYVSLSHNIDSGNSARGNRARAIGYSVPWDYWWLDFYASQSRYRQHMQGNWSQWMLNNNNHYYSLQLNRLLSREVAQKTSVGLQLFKMDTRYFLNDIAMESMSKKSAGWKAILQHQHNFSNAVIVGSLSYQKKMPWFNSADTVEQKGKIIDAEGRIIQLDLQAAINFNAMQQQFNYSPHFMLQFTPDRLSSIEKFALGNRWTVRGFDGENSLQENKGWYWRNDLAWRAPDRNYQPYLGIDMGRAIGDQSQQFYSGKTLVGTTIGVRGAYLHIDYDLFAGIPLKKPQGFYTDPVALGFSLHWKY